MTAKPNYFKIGLFILIAIILIVATIIIWGAGVFAKDKTYFETYFDSDVTGLVQGSSVQLRGVKIGQVERVEFVDEVYEMPADPSVFTKYERYVRVLCSITREETPKEKKRTTTEREERIKSMIDQGLRLRLSTNILTGQAFLEGTFLEPERFPALDIVWKPKETYVPSAPGAFSTMKDSVDRILAKLEEIDIQGVVRNLDELLISIRTAVDDANVPGMTNEIQGFFADARQTNKDLQDLLSSPDVDKRRANVAQILANLESTLDRIDKKLATESPQIDKILSNLREITDDIKELTENIKQHPSEIIFSQPPAKSEMIK
ncbi:MAG: MlaD family protein [Planctomycetota bacterium]|jgi:phospholipid/cholesterol/gamma-HCH transport system substrate-binding protein/paraquat-inducible protein B